MWPVMGKLRDTPFGLDELLTQTLAEAWEARMIFLPLSFCAAGSGSNPFGRLSRRMKRQFPKDYNIMPPPRCILLELAMPSVKCSTSGRHEA